MGQAGSGVPLWGRRPAQAGSLLCGDVWLQGSVLEVMHECLLLLPLCSSLPPQSALCSAEPARVLGPLLQEAITLLAGLLLGRQAKKAPLRLSPCSDAHC